MTDISAWIKSIPFFTRYWLGASVVFPVLGRIGLINGMNMMLFYEPLFHKFQIWRPLTALVYYPISPMTGFHYLTNLYFLYSYSVRLETDTFLGRPADYCFALLFMAATCIVTGLAVGLPLLMDPMVLAVLYVWCQLNKNVIMNFWFGTQFKAMYLPWVVLLFNMVITGSFLNELTGILVGHLFYFLKFKYPLDFGGSQLLLTPTFLENLFPNRRGEVIRGPVQSQSLPQQPRQQASYRWGRGHVLGRD